MERAQGKVERYLALDAYRGLIMLMLVSYGFGFGELKDHPVYGVIASQFAHVPWEGAVFWDMVQPAFMFIVGVAMPFAIAIRTQKGSTPSELARHAFLRGLKLILLSQILICASSGRLHFQLVNVLSQIAFTYVLTFWLLRLRFQWQVVTAGGILAFHTLLFVAFPGPEGAFSREGNIGAVIDQSVGLHYRGLYVTINFLTSTVTTLFGAWCGMLLLNRKSHAQIVKYLAAGAVGSFALSFVLGLFVPNVKRIWTATFTLYSAGWVILMLLAMYLIVEVAGWRRWTFPLVVIGANSIFIYSLNMVLRGWLSDKVAVFTGGFEFIGDLAPVAQRIAVLAMMFYVNYWLYRRKIFLKV